MLMSHHLDEKNQQILKLLSEGNTIKEIAGKIYLSRDGINYRLRELKDKTGCKSNPQLVCYFYDDIQEFKNAS
jgi:DNA-binding NarL/FixJ family response regulator